MHTFRKISRILTVLILATMLLSPARASAAVEPASIQSGYSEETAALVSSGMTLRQAQDSAQSTQAAKARILEAYSRLPLSFIPNQGQVDERVGYYVQSSGQSLWFTADGVTMALPEMTLRLEFLGANPLARLEGGEKLPGIVNYFIGNDPAQWRTNIPTYGRGTYCDLWPGVDLTYEGQPGALKSTFTVAPGADPAQIRLAYPNADSLVVDRQGNLVISIAGRKVQESAPLAWQEIDGRRVPVTVAHQVMGQSYGFALPEDYNLAYPLVIDPELVYSTFLGGGGNEYVYAVAVDGAGSAYVTGQTLSSDFPTTAGAFDTSHNGGNDAFVTKLAFPPLGTVTPGGGSLTSSTDQTTYTFAAGTFTDTVIIAHAPLLFGTVLPASNLIGIGHGFEVTAVYSDTGQPAQPTQPYTVTVQYTEAEKGLAVEDTLALYYWDGSQWVKEPSSEVDTVNNTVTATPNHFSSWAVLGETRRIFLPIILKSY